MQYRLFAYAYDRGSDLGFQRNASAFLKDPLGASGVGFQEISGNPVPASGRSVAVRLRPCRSRSDSAPARPREEMSRHVD